MQKQRNKILVLLTLGLSLMLFNAIHAKEVISLKQQPGLSGKVTDINTGEPMVGVTIMVKETNKGTRSQKDGTYSIDIGEDGKTIVLSYTGYQTLQVDIDGREQIDISLTPANTSQEDDALWGL